MIPLPCLAPYLTQLQRPGTTCRGLGRNAGWAVENVCSFAPYFESTRVDWACQTLLIIETVGDQCTVKTLCEADYTLPRTLGSLPRWGTRVNAIFDEIAPQLRAQGWGNPMSRLTDMDGLEAFACFRLHPTDSMHQWLEQIKSVAPMFDNLADSGFDVRPDLERFLANAR